MCVFSSYFWIVGGTSYRGEALGETLGVPAREEKTEEGVPGGSRASGDVIMRSDSTSYCDASPTSACETSNSCSFSLSLRRRRGGRGE